jgi:N-acetyl-alpha-D-glucosaminyl L-malate synthase BshA
MIQPRRRLPFVTTLHGTDITLVGTDRSYFPITKFSIEQSDGVTTVSEYLRRQTVEVFGIGRDIEVVNNFINSDVYRPDPELRAASRFAPPGEKVLIHISNFRPVKRVLDCIRILQLVRREVPAHLLMVGDGPDRSPGERFARELGVERHVTFLGKQDHIERLIPQAHVLLLPSELEAFGLAALEAMACGVPPIATSAGGVPDLIDHGVNGFMEPPGHVAAQARHAIDLLTDDNVYDRVSSAARESAVRRFSTSLIIPMYERYYEQICA